MAHGCMSMEYGCSVHGCVGTDMSDYGTVALRVKVSLWYVRYDYLIYGMTVLVINWPRKLKMSKEYPGHDIYR